MGIEFFRKNKIDLDLSAVSIVVTDLTADDDGQDFVDFMRNRNNTSGWSTTGSNDAANTTLIIDLVGENDIDTIILVGHNLKAYTLKYWNGSSYVAFSTAIAETTNTATTNRHTFNSVSTSSLQLIITGTQVANADKLIAQIIVTEKYGELEVQPEIMPIIDKNRKAVRYLSGKSHIVKSIESFSVKIRKDNVTSDTDLSLVETLYGSYEGFLVWICGGETAQYPTQRFGYRLQDIYLMNVSNEYKPEWNESRYKQGMSIDISLVEVV